MNAMFAALGVIDIIAGAILFIEQPIIVRVISVILLTKGIITFIKAVC